MLLKYYFINSFIHEDNRGYCPVFRTNTKFFSVLIFSGEQKTLPCMKFAYFLTPVSSHILFRYILHMPASLYEWSVGNALHSQISIPDISFLLALSWHRKSQHGTSCVHWRTWEWSDPESVLGERCMRWDLKANSMPFCSSYTPPVPSEGPEEMEK